MTHSKHITDYDIQALVDNELDWEGEKNVRDHVARNTYAAQRFQDLKNQKQLLQNWVFHQKLN